MRPSTSYRFVADTPTPRMMGPKSERFGAAAELFEDLNRHGLRYCVWKSNVRLEEGLRGETDLDVLVDRKHADAFVQVLCEHGIKAVAPPPDRAYPAIEHYLGFDQESGRIFHLHVHYQLVLGERFVKNYRLPLEEVFLDRVEMRRGIKVPLPELELVVLSLRILLKYRLRDLVKDVLSIKTPGIPAFMLAEVNHLVGQTSWDRVLETLEELSGALPSAGVRKFLDTVRSRPRAGCALWRLRARVRRELSACRRHSPLEATAEYFRKLVGRWRFLTEARTGSKMTLPRGGVTIALVGVDGAGKTTLAQALVHWLDWRLDVRTYYLGSKQPSGRSRLLYLLYRAFRRGRRLLAPVGLFARAAGALGDTALALHHLSIGYDRLKRYRASQKIASRGCVVIYDRFPLQWDVMPDECHLMDGPQIAFVSGHGANTVTGALARLEYSIYQKMLPPDYLFLLEVSPHVSRQRKPDHKPSTLEAKRRAAARIRSAGSLPARAAVACLNADRPLEQVVDELKRAVWEVL